MTIMTKTPSENNKVYYSTIWPGVLPHLALRQERPDMLFQVSYDLLYW